MKQVNSNILPTAQIEPILHGLLENMDTIYSQCGERFPLYSVERSNDWFHSAGGSWLGGYWPALWWMKAKKQKECGEPYQREREIAQQFSSKLSSKWNIDSAYRASIFYYGACLGNKWFGCTDGSPGIREAGEQLRQMYNPSLDAISLGKDFGGGIEGGDTLAVDYLASLVQFSQCTGNTQLKSVVNKTLVTFINKACDNGPCLPEIHLIGSSSKQKKEAGNWARGQAWAILGLVRAAEHSDSEQAFNQALTALDFWENRWANQIPFDTFSIPEGGDKDASALIIVAIALLSIAKIVSSNTPLANQYYQSALEKLKTVCESEYLSPIGNNQNGTLAFWGACYKTREGTQRVESPWGLFYLSGALASILGWVDPRDL